MSFSSLIFTKPIETLGFEPNQHHSELAEAKPHSFDRFASPTVPWRSLLSTPKLDVETLSSCALLQSDHL